jgi:hypothetical protein
VAVQKSFTERVKILFANLLIRNSWRSVIGVDCPAFDVLMAFKYVLHNCIVLMGVNPDVADLRFAVMKRKIHDTVASAVGSDAVNDPHKEHRLTKTRFR